MNLMMIQGSVELGLIYAIMSLGVFLSFRTLNMPDLTVDSSFVLGAAVSAIMCTNGYPVLGLLLAILAGCLAGAITAFLNTKLNIQPVLAGFLAMLALYSVNLRVMDSKSNIPLINTKTVFNTFEKISLTTYSEILLATLILFVVLILLFLFLKTKFGFVLRATGDNDVMVRTLGTSTDFTTLIGLGISNSLVALSGAMIAQYQSFADMNMGTGMAMIGLASVIIGEGLFGISSLLRRLIAIILGSILYRLVIALALEMGMPAMDLKLISATIVVIALSLKTIKKRAILLKKRLNARKNQTGGKADA